MVLTDEERMELQRRAKIRRGKLGSSRRARLILLLAAGHSHAEIGICLGCSEDYIERWRRHFEANRLEGFFATHAGRKPYKVTVSLEAQVLLYTLHQPPVDGSVYWSSRKLAAALGGAVSHMTIMRIWAKHGIDPQALASQREGSKRPS